LEWCRAMDERENLCRQFFKVSSSSSSNNNNNNNEDDDDGMTAMSNSIFNFV
jgi:hypothetical protein